jgi:hypothetical protein
MGTHARICVCVCVCVRECVFWIKKIIVVADQKVVLEVVYTNYKTSKYCSKYEIF